MGTIVMIKKSLDRKKQIHATVVYHNCGGGMYQPSAATRGPLLHPKYTHGLLRPPKESETVALRTTFLYGQGQFLERQ